MEGISLLVLGTQRGGSAIRVPHGILGPMSAGDKDKQTIKENLLRQGVPADEIQKVYRTLRESGATFGEESRLMTFSEFNGLVGVEKKYALARRYGADS